MKAAVVLTAEMLEAFSGVYLSPRYDQPQPTPDFHREGWTYYCSPVAAAALAAPRNHAKSTSFTHDFILANACFRVEDYIILIGSSEEMAIEHLGDIANELRENEELIRDFHIKGFVQEQKTDIIVECHDGYQFRIVARGAEQKIRGRKWRGKRPGLIVGDDLEDDEQVINADRRRRFSQWFFRAAKQALRDGGRIRVHGTILHEDSLLAGLIKIWGGRIYKAHRAFDDFSEILWPEKFSASRLRQIRDEFVKRLDSAGYSAEYLNDPFDSDDTYIRKEDLLPMSAEDYKKRKKLCAAADFAIATHDRANRTSFSVGGKDVDNILHHIDQRVGRWNALEIIEEMFLIQTAHNPELFWVEDGQIWKAIWPMIQAEMRRRDIWINFRPITSTKDKAARGRSFQKRTRAHAYRVDKEASWYAPFEHEVLRFSEHTEATLDDQFDSVALLSRGFEEFYDLEEEDFESEEMQEFIAMALAARSPQGRNPHTGY